MIYFVRHGETKSNVKLIFSNQGRTRLTKRGIQQAQQTARELKNIEFDYVFCSPLTRARQTMKEVLALQKGKPKVVYDSRLVERKYGSYTDKSIYLIKENRLDINYIPPEKGFESCQDMIDRSQDFLNSIVEFKGKNILVVAHMEIGCALGYCFSKDKNDTDITKFACKNAQCKIYEF